MDRKRAVAAAGSGRRPATKKGRSSDVERAAKKRKARRPRY